MKSTIPTPRRALAGALLAVALSACGASATPTAGLITAARQAPAPASAAPLPTAPAAAQPIAATQPEALSGTGEIAAAQRASLSFLAQGRVERVIVREGQAVRAGDLLALLDPRPFDAGVAQAEAALAAAQAQQAALGEGGRTADRQAAAAQVQQARVALAQARTGQTEDTRAAEAALAAAQSGLQSARDQLSLAKSISERQVAQAAQALTQAQARYAQATYNWEYAQRDGRDPIQPTVVNTSTGKVYDNKLSDGAKEAYYAQFVQATAALRQAEESVAQAQLQLEHARQAEVTGIAAAEQQVAQAQAGLNKLRAPAGEDRVAAAQAALALAQANLSRLDADPSDSQRGQAAAGVASAEAALAQARLSREYAELRAPFDGVVAAVGIEVGELAGPGQPAIALIDTASLRFEVPIDDIDIGRVALGDPALVALDAIPGASYEGVVTYIAPAAELRGGARSYLVHIALAQMEGARVGMSGRVDLLGE